MIHKDIQRGTGVEGVTSEDYWYDGANRMTYAQNDYSTVTRKYNSYSEVYEETSAVTIDGQTQTKTVNSEFDRLGNRTALIYPSGKRLNYTHDELDRVKYISEVTPLLGGDAPFGDTQGPFSGGVGNIAAYQYNGYRMKQRKSGNGTQLDVEYDAMRRITSYNNTKASVPPNGTQDIAGFSYGYNKEGMRTYENYNPGAGETNQSPKAKVFTYDSLYQITGVKYDVPNPLAEIAQPGSQTYSKTVGYQFDNSGNRNAVETTRWGVSSTSQSYQSNTLNQYTQIDNGIFGYDSVGNMTTGVIYLDDMANPGQKTLVQARFVYDYSNELVRLERQADSAVLGEYAYDALGRRVYKNAWNGESTAYQATYFWYNGVECIEETSISGTTIAVYTFGIGIDEAISIEYPITSEQYPQAGTYWYHTDVLGSVVAITDSNGSVVERYKYDIYGEATVLAPEGETIRAESVTRNRLLYTGREYDKETGLYYYRARYYNAQIGRFISTDSIGADILGNLFTYTKNSPINWTDNFGLDPELTGHEMLATEIKLWEEWRNAGAKNAQSYITEATAILELIGKNNEEKKQVDERKKHVAEAFKKIREGYGEMEKNPSNPIVVRIVNETLKAAQEVLEKDTTIEIHETTVTSIESGTIVVDCGYIIKKADNTVEVGVVTIPLSGPGEVMVVSKRTDTFFITTLTYAKTIAALKFVRNALQYWKFLKAISLIADRATRYKLLEKFDAALYGMQDFLIDYSSTDATVPVTLFELEFGKVMKSNGFFDYIEGLHEVGPMVEAKLYKLSTEEKKNMQENLIILRKATAELMEQARLKSK